MNLKEIIAILTEVNEKNQLFKESLDDIYPLYIELANEFSNIANNEVQYAAIQIHDFANHFQTNALAAAIFGINKAFASLQLPKSFPINFIKEDPQEAIALLERVIKHSETKMSYEQEIEIGKTNLLPDGLSEKELLVLEDVLVVTLEETLPGKEIEASDLIGINLLYSVLFETTNRIGRLPVFFHLTQLYIHCLNVNLMHQIARDLSFHVLQLSKDLGFTEYGVFGLTKTFLDQKNTASGGTFLYLATTLILRKESIYNKTLTELLFEVYKFARDSKYFPLEESVYKLLKSKQLSSREQRRVEHIHLSTLCSKDPINYAELVIITIMNLMEDIKGDLSESIPWLTLLYSLKKYNNNSAEADKINYLILFLEGTLPEAGRATVTQYRVLTLGHDDNRENIKIATNIFGKMLDSRYKDDIKYDLKNLVRISEHIVRIALLDSSLDDLIFGLNIKSDVSINIQTSTLEGLKRKITKDGVFNTTKAEEYLHSLRVSVTNSKTESSLFIFSDNSKTMIVQVNPGQKDILSNSVDDDIFRKTILSAHAIFDFDEYRVVHGATIDYSEQEQLSDLKKVQDILPAFSAPAPIDTKAIAVIRDVESSFIPFNLFRSNNGEFLSLSHIMFDPMSRAISRSNTGPSQISHLTSEFWCPIDGGDYPLNILRARLDNVIGTYSITTHDTAELNSPLSSLIQIVAAHGRNDIADFNALFINDKAAVTNFDHIFGNTGKVAILFVCHSGSSNKNYYNFTLNSMVRYLIETKKFEAVIAPCWSLHISIPPLYLEKVLSSLSEGETIGVSHLYAINSVFSKNKNPGAWGCLHLFGNSNFCLSNEQIKTSENLGT